MKNSIQLVLLLSLFACHTATKQQDMQTDTSSIRATMTSAVDTVKPIEKSDAEWKAELTPQEYYVLRERGTERAFSGDLWDYHGDGIFVCAACGLPLFDSHTKFESGTGWPSFYQPIEDDAVGTSVDKSFFMTRTEVHCANCGGHLGHIFDDGPKPTGLRHCINGVALKFDPKTGA